MARLAAGEPRHQSSVGTASQPRESECRRSAAQTVKASPRPSRDGAVFSNAWGPYQSLAVLLIPVSCVEPLKLIAVAVAGEGHWIASTTKIIGAYAASLLFVERLFRSVKPKLLKLRWFARLWGVVCEFAQSDRASHPGGRRAQCRPAVLSIQVPLSDQNRMPADRSVL
jgi:hypothetical protein